ncbi:MAG: hypothetical protein GXY44_10235 [Phycisphaerales bacterium]|nr:hypothetical protein [Phycisphaerales bacterium]
MISLLLGQAIENPYDRIRSISERFSEPEPETGAKIAAFLVCLICVFLLFGLIYRIQQRKSNPKKARPLGLFLRMQSGLNLPLLDRWHLWRLARTANILQPAALLISETLFDKAVTAYCGTTESSSGPAAVRYQRIRQRLFDSTTDDHPVN